jgi:hypothetical protein
MGQEVPITFTSILVTVIDVSDDARYLRSGEGVGGALVAVVFIAFGFGCSLILKRLAYICSATL